MVSSCRAWGASLKPRRMEVSSQGVCELLSLKDDREDGPSPRVD
jgi:hypothetical protein